MRYCTSLILPLFFLLGSCKEIASTSTSLPSPSASEFATLGVGELGGGSSLRGQQEDTVLSSTTIGGLLFTKGNSKTDSDDMYRYINTEYTVTNNNSEPLTNVTLLAVGSTLTYDPPPPPDGSPPPPSPIPDSPFTSLKDENGNELPSSLAVHIRPTHGFIRSGNAIIPDSSPTRASFQLYLEDNVIKFNGRNNITNIFPWGYVVTRTSTGMDDNNIRTLSPKDTDKNTGHFTLAIAVPKNTNIHRFTIRVVAVTTPEFRTTRDILERTKDLTETGTATATRANLLSTQNGGAHVIVATMPNDINFSCGQCTVLSYSNPRLIGTQVASSVRMLPGFTLTQVAYQGDSVETGVTYNTFGNPVLNEAGQVAFQATLSGGPASSSSGIFFSTPDSVQPVALQGYTAPGAGGATYGTFSNTPVLNDSDQVAFSSTLSTGKPGIFLGTPGMFGLPGVVETVAVQGASIPGIAGATYGVLNPSANLILNETGQVAFFSGNDATATTEKIGIFLGSPDSVQVVALQGATDSGSGAYAFSSLPGIASDANKVAFSSPLSGVTGVTGGIFLRETGSVQTVALKGTSSYYSNFLSTSPVLNNSGQVAFQGTVTVPASGTKPAQTLSGIYLWEGQSGTVQTVALQGNTAPPGAATYGSLTTAPVLNNAGQVAFSAPLIGGASASGLFLGTPGSVNAVALQGKIAPGAGGATFGALNSTSLVLNDHNQNGSGQVAFISSLGGTGVGSTNNSALYVGTPDNLHLIVRKGDEIDVDPTTDVPKTVASINLVTGSGGQDGKPRSFNNSGKLVFKLGFTDNSQGIYTIN